MQTSLQWFYPVYAVSKLVLTSYSPNQLITDLDWFVGVGSGRKEVLVVPPPLSDGLLHPQKCLCTVVVLVFNILYYNMWGCPLCSHCCHPLLSLVITGIAAA